MASPSSVNPSSTSPLFSGLSSANQCSCLRCSHERKTGTKIGNIFMPEESYTMFVCSCCGNKRCPHSDDHRKACSNSNDAGQVGSRFGVLLPKVFKI